MGTKNATILWFIGLVLIAPIIVYAYNFGIGFWDTPSEWSDLGGYIGGIYTPILTVLTLLVLSVQIYLQAAQHKQTLIAHQEQQLKEYITELESELNIEVGGGVRLRDMLNLMFRDKAKEDIENWEPGLLFELNQRHHKVYSMWCGVIGCLRAINNLSSQKCYESGHYFSQRNRVVSFLNPQVCRTLDKYNYGITCEFDKMTHSNQASTWKPEFWEIEKGV